MPGRSTICRTANRPRSRASASSRAATASFYIEDKQVVTIVYRKDPDWNIYPMDKIPPDQELFLKGLQAEGARASDAGRQPRLTIRPSQREARSQLPHPDFPLLKNLEERKKRLIEERRWTDRNDQVDAATVSGCGLWVSKSASRGSSGAPAPEKVGKVKRDRNPFHLFVLFFGRLVVKGYFPMKKKSDRFGFGTLALGMAEFVMMGILPDIARSLGVSIPEAGHPSPPMRWASASGRPSRCGGRTRPLKHILLALTGLIILGNACAALCRTTDSAGHAFHLEGFPTGPSSAWGRSSPSVSPTRADAPRPCRSWSWA